MDVDDYSGADGMRELFTECVDLAQSADIETLSSVLLTRASRTYEKHEVPRIAAAAMLTLGSDGVRELVKLINVAAGSIYPMAIMRALWLAGSDQPVLISSLDIRYPELDVSEATRADSRVALDDLIMRAQSDGNLFNVLLSLQNSETPLRGISPFNIHVMDVIRTSAIILTEALLDEFDSLVSLNEPEAAYQSFLEEHPVFIDPLAAEIMNRQRLGVELVTDFVIRRHDFRYVTVEIEKPQDSLFTRGGDFRAEFTHAVGQVMDFQGWVAANVAYAQKHLPLIENPSGLLVMGRRSDMSPAQQQKLRRWCANSTQIKVVTFDDLALRGRSLHASLRRYY